MSDANVQIEAVDPNAICAKSLTINVTGAPSEFMYMPGGTHTIQASKGGKPYKTKVLVDEKSAQALQASLTNLKGERAPHSPWFDFDHKMLEASAHPQSFSWKGGAKQGVYVKVKWSPKGKEAVQAAADEAPTHQGFSGTFFTDEGKGGGGVERITGMSFCGGGLVNSPAFRAIAPVAGTEVSTEEVPLFCNECEQEEVIEAGAPMGNRNAAKDYAPVGSGQHAEGVVGGKAYSSFKYKPESRWTISSVVHENPSKAADDYAAHLKEKGYNAKTLHTDMEGGGLHSVISTKRGEASTGPAHHVEFMTKENPRYKMFDEQGYVKKASELPEDDSIQTKDQVIISVLWNDITFAVTAMEGELYKLDRPLHGDTVFSRARLDELVAVDGLVIVTGDKPAPLDVVPIASATHIEMHGVRYPIAAKTDDIITLDRPLRGTTTFTVGRLQELIDTEGAVMCGAPMGNRNAAKEHAANLSKAALASSQTAHSMHADDAAKSYADSASKKVDKISSTESTERDHTGLMATHDEAAMMHNGAARSAKGAAKDAHNAAAKAHYTAGRAHLALGGKSARDLDEMWSPGKQFSKAMGRPTNDD